MNPSTLMFLLPSRGVTKAVKTAVCDYPKQTSNSGQGTSDWQFSGTEIPREITIDFEPLEY